MSTFSTPYGDLSGVEFRTLFSNGKMDGCLVTEANSLKTPYGTLVPQYEAEDMGRRSVKPLLYADEAFIICPGKFSSIYSIPHSKLLL